MCVCTYICIDLDDSEYNRLANSSCSWICPNCDSSNFTTNLPVTGTLDSFSSTNNFDILGSNDNNVDQNKAKSSKNHKKHPGKRSTLSVLLVNCQTVRNKVADLATVIEERKPDIILGNESWLRPDINSKEIFPSNYNVFRKDRVNQAGGGVFQAVKKDIIVNHKDDFDSNCEILWTQCLTQVQSKKCKSILLGSFYRPHLSYMASLIELDVSLSKIANLINTNSVILGGDFNAPNISWENNQVLDHLATSERLTEIANEYDLEQLVKEPTRIHSNTENILDLVFTNNNTTVNNAKITRGISDHDIVSFTVNLAPKKKRLAKRKIYIRKRSDQEKLNKQLSGFATQFVNSTTNMSVDGKWKVFVQNITSIMDDCIPHKLSSSRFNLPWF